MKASRPIFVLALTGFLALPAILHAQTITTAVPGFISYQGRVLDGSGNPVGAGTPVNRTVIFRIWDHSSNTLAANLIYSEQQTVTISEGEFSVLVGQGVTVSSTTQFGYSEVAKKLADPGLAFTGPIRYLGVTVDDGTATPDNEITPRQQIVSSGYAFRSRTAESLGTSVGGNSLNVLDNGNIGVGNTNPPARFTITGSNTGTNTPQLLVTDSVDPNERLRIGVDNTGNGTGFIQSFKEFVGAQNLILNPNGGFVGIGKTPAVMLDVNGTIAAPALGIGTTTSAFPIGFPDSLGDKISLWGQSGNSFGFGIAPSTLQIHTNTSASDIAFGYGSSAAFNETVRFKGNGFVGIGTNNPLVALHVANASNFPMMVDSANGIGTWLDLRNTSFGGTNWHLISTGSLNGEGAGKLLFGQGAIPGQVATIPLVLTSNNRVGIGTASPGYPLSMGDALGDKISLYGQGAAHYGFGIQGSLLQIHSESSASDIAFGYGSSTAFNERMRVKGNGYVTTVRALTGVGVEDAFVINKTTPTAPNPAGFLVVRTFGNNGPLNLELFEGAAYKPGGGSWGVVSDKRLKKDIAPLQGSLDKLLQLRSVTYKYIDPEKSHQLPGTQTGFVAQEVEKVFPDWVTVNGDGYKTINVRGFESLTVQAMRELREEKDTEIKALKTEVADGSKKIASLEKRLAELEEKDKARSGRLEAIEKILASGGSPKPARTVALKKGVAAE